MEKVWPVRKGKKAEDEEEEQNCDHQKNDLTVGRKTAESVIQVTGHWVVTWEIAWPSS